MRTTARFLFVPVLLCGTAHAQSVTVQTAEVKPAAIAGTRAMARVLLDETSVAAKKASLTQIELPTGARWQRDGSTGTAIVYVQKGRVTSGKQTIEEGDALVFPEGSARRIAATLPAELLVLLVPPGAEAAYRKGARLATAELGPEPTLHRHAAAQKYPILKGRGEAAILVETAAASVQRMQIAPGAAVPEHAHATEAEILWTVAGNGELRVDGRAYPIKLGTAIYVPPGARHSFTAGSEQSFQAIQFYAPAGPEQRFKNPAARPPADAEAPAARPSH